MFGEGIDNTMNAQATLKELAAMGATRVQGVFDSSPFRRLAYAYNWMFAGRRNLYDVFGYAINPTYNMRYFKYLRQDVAARVVDAPAAALWTNPPQVTSTDPNWNLLWEDLIARHNMYSNIERADKLAGIGRYSLLLIGYNDAGDLSQPVNTRAVTQKTDKLLYLQPYGEGTITIKSYNQNNRSENFMRPELYTIQPMSDNVIGFSQKDSKGGKSLSSFDVHASRVVHIAENILENSVYGSPRMERVYNILDDILKVTGGSAETFWLTANRGLHIDIDKELEMDADDAKNLSAEIDEYTNQLRRVIRTRGTKVTPLGSDSPDPTGTFKVLISVLSGATGIPNRILIGAEAGQLASEQDRANWADRVDERRASWGNPYVLFPLIKNLTRAGYLPSNPAMEITVEWPTAFKMSPLEKAQTSAQHARSATNFAKAIETMENLKRGTPGTPDTKAPDGSVTPGVPAVPGIDLGGSELITVDEAREMIGLDKPPVTFDSGSDVGPEGTPTPKALPVPTGAKAPASTPKTNSRSVTISLARIMRF